MGYIVLEYFCIGKLLEKIDVFGYGIIFFELVIGQCVIDFLCLEEEENIFLFDYVRFEIVFFKFFCVLSYRNQCWMCMKQIKKLLREQRLRDIVDCNLIIYDLEEVEIIV